MKINKHPAGLKKPHPQSLEINFSGENYRFHFYINEYGRYVALCAGRSDVFGEGHHWWEAAQQCMLKILGGKW